MIKQDSFILIWTEGISIKGFLSPKENPVFENLNIRIDSGEYAAISGIYGNDRISFINALGCLCKPNAGKYLFDYNDIGTLEPGKLEDIRSKFIGFIFKGLNIIDDLTVYRNIELPLVRKEEQEKKKAVEEAAEKLGLREVLHKKAGQLTDLERHKVSLARAMAVKPVLILADEPGEGLSSQDAAVVMDILDKVNKEGTAILVFSDKEAIIGRAERHIVFENNRIKTDSGNARPNSKEGAV
jgi:putative ABC transport system ATP-binding protein